MAQPIVTTSYGKVRGSAGEGCTAFLNIPYARPPVGELRLRGPVRPEPWSDVRDADEFGPIAPQPNFGLGSYVPGDPTEQSEDCLSLNIWVPELESPGLNPVMVFFHGGSFLTGSGAGVMYRGDRLASLGVIVVTINYRLGALGYLAHRDLGEDGSIFGNWGLADQIAALTWVRENIAAFGGDANNLTCFGESAGAMSIADLFAVPSASRLFSRAILQSGAEVADELGAAERLASHFAKALGMSDLSRDALSGVPLEELLGAQVAAAAALEGSFLSFKPVIDGVLITESPSLAVSRGASRQIDVLFGTNRDEFKFFTFGAKELAELDTAGLERIVDRYIASGSFEAPSLRARQVIDCYVAARSARGEGVSPRDLLDAIATDAIFRVPMTRLGEAHVRSGGRGFAYRFDWPSPFGDGGLGACHGLELPFVFRTLENPVIAMFAGGSPEALRLSDQLQACWVSFARFGVPAAEGLEEWLPYDEVSRPTMVFGSDTELVDAPQDRERQFWDERLPRYGEIDPVSSLHVRS